MAAPTVTVLDQITQVGKASGITLPGNYREDLWMRVREINFPKKTKLATVVITMTGPDIEGIDGQVITSAGPITTGRALTDNGGPVVVGGFAAHVELDDTDLTHFFAITTGPDGRPVYISYQEELDFILATHPGTVIKGDPTGHDSAGNAVPRGGMPPYFMQVVVVGHGDPSYTDLKKSAVAIQIDEDHPGAITFSITQLSPSQLQLTNTAVIVAYEGLPKLAAQADGTITVSAPDPPPDDPKPPELKTLWSASVSRPNGSTAAATTVKLKITDTALVS